ncbi:MAG: hypothetical protein D6704_02625 [Nitrospirae bacterium]|nr:MAG: hypothetical protein D6704_02625 [Nitrospirota bacterium]
MPEEEGLRGLIMGQRSLEEEKTFLRQKVKERQAHSENPAQDRGLRALRKRLKRVQRKLRIQTTRRAKAHPAGKST